MRQCIFLIRRQFRCGLAQGGNPEIRIITKAAGTAAHKTVGTTAPKQKLHVKGQGVFTADPATFNSSDSAGAAPNKTARASEHAITAQAPRNEFDMRFILPPFMFDGSEEAKWLFSFPPFTPAEGSFSDRRHAVRKRIRANGEDR